jgi:hypothetical protein
MSRLLALQRALQTEIDRQPDLFARPRIAVTIRLTLDDLAWLLPPAEQRLLAHLRARKPLRALDGTRGCHTVSRRNERLQRLLSRVQAYCGAPTRHRLMQPYDRPGHQHRHRAGVRRRLIPLTRLPVLVLWVPPVAARSHPGRFKVLDDQFGWREPRRRYADEDWAR